MKKIKSYITEKLRISSKSKFENYDMRLWDFAKKYELDVRETGFTRSFNIAVYDTVHIDCEISKFIKKILKLNKNIVNNCIDEIKKIYNKYYNIDFIINFAGEKYGIDISQYDDFHEWNPHAQFRLINDNISIKFYIPKNDNNHEQEKEFLDSIDNIIKKIKDEH